MRAPITARVPARGLQDRSAYDKNICKTRNAAAAHTAVRLSSTVTTTATAETTAAKPTVRTRSPRWGSVISSAPKKHAPAANSAIGNGSATPTTKVTATSVAHESIVAHAVRAPRRVRTKPGSTISSRAATPPITEMTASSSEILENRATAQRGPRQRIGRCPSEQRRSANGDDDEKTILRAALVVPPAPFPEFLVAEPHSSPAATFWAAALNSPLTPQIKEHKYANCG